MVTEAEILRGIRQGRDRMQEFNGDLRASVKATGIDDVALEKVIMGMAAEIEWDQPLGVVGALLVAFLCGYETAKVEAAGG